MPTAGTASERVTALGHRPPCGVAANTYPDNSAALAAAAMSALDWVMIPDRSVRVKIRATRIVKTHT